MATREVTFDPTLWAAGIGSTWGSNGKDCATVIPDKDGYSLWCFEYFGAGWARVDSRDGTIIQQDALFGTPGSSNYLDTRENGSVALFTQDSHGFYYTSCNNVIYKFHIPTVTGPYTPNGTLLNGYAVVDATYDYSALATYIEDWSLSEIGATTYLAGSSTFFSTNQWARAFIFNGTTMTHAGTYMGEGDNLYAGNTVTVDSNGIFWMSALMTPTYPFPVPPESPPNNIDGQLVKLDMTTGSLVTSVQVIPAAVHGLSYTPFFLCYVPSINGLVMAPFDQHSSDDICVMSMNTWTRLAYQSDNLKFFIDNQADSPENAFTVGVQNGKLMFEGSPASSPNQLGSFLQVVDPTDLTVLETVDCVAEIISAGLPDQAESTQFFNAQNAFISSCSSDGSTGTAIATISDVLVPPATKIIFSQLSSATWFNNHQYDILTSSGTTITFTDTSGHGAFSPTTENPPYSLAGTRAVVIPPLSTFGWQESVGKVGACYLFSGSPLYIFDTSSAPIVDTVNQIIGGGFIDSLGNPLANGYLILSLSQDGIVNGTTQVCAGREIVVPLDSNGNVVTSPPYYLWPNDVITPSGTFYVVSAYTSKGQLVWGPNAQTVLKTPSPFDTTAWIVGDIN
jgi:hypothetical protein